MISGYSLCGYDGITNPIASGRKNRYIRALISAKSFAPFLVVRTQLVAVGNATACVSTSLFENSII